MYNMSKEPRFDAYFVRNVFRKHKHEDDTIADIYIAKKALYSNKDHPEHFTNYLRTKG